MRDRVKIVECPRDAWQGLPGNIPVETKVSYVRSLAAAGFRHIDAVSFVSPAAVPQMADSERVLAALGAMGDVEIIGIVVNTKGAERAIASGAVRTLGFPYSISPEFLKKNQHQTLQEAFVALTSISALAQGAGINVVVYLSMAFGNPYGEVWEIRSVTDACELLAERGIPQISLADTVGLASAARVAETVGGVLAAGGDFELGVHLHAQPLDAAEKIRAAYRSGCRRFDAAIGGLGGCPFAQNALVANVRTETLIEVLKEEGAELPPMKPLDELIRASAEIAERYGSSAVRGMASSV